MGGSGVGGSGVGGSEASCLGTHLAEPQGSLAQFENHCCEAKEKDLRVGQRRRPQFLLWFCHFWAVCLFRVS